MSVFPKVRLLFLVGLFGYAMAGHAAAEDPPAQEQSVQLAMSSNLSDGASMPYPPLPLSLTLPVQAIEEDAPPPPLIDLTVAPDELWQRMRNGFGMPDLHNPLVADRQSWYLNRPEMLQRIFERGRRYLYHIVEELEKRGMPTELALLPMVESAFNPQAVSSARAMGIWQFIPATGKNYKLDQNWWVDERRDIIASTDAALNYLQNIYEMHGDWHLALASYNWGENAVARAIAKNEAKGLPTDYSSLTMPAETRYYVPKLQALKNIVAQPELFGIRLPGVANQPYFETVVKPQRMDVAVAARLAEIPIEEFVSLNPAYHRPVMNSHQAGPLVLPADKVGTFLANLERYEAQDIPLSNWQTHQMKRGDTLEKVAAKYGIDATRLKQINGITRRLKIGPGFNLLVPRPGGQANPDQIARALPKLAPEKAPAVKSVRGGKTAKGKALATTKTKTKAPARPAAKKAAAKPQPKKKR
jgi:membrane-bound lytic murein transglycosylase D